MKYHLLFPAVLLAFCGCRSDLYYQERAVESAREFVYEHARELTPDQFAFVRLTPPVLLTGTILEGHEKNNVKNSLSGRKRMQICVTWRIPDQKTDYLVFGISGPSMEYWRPLKLFRRKIGRIDNNAQKALEAARRYAMSSLYEQLTAAELNTVRFAYPELALTSFLLEQPETEEEKKLLSSSLPEKSESKEESGPEKSGKESENRNTDEEQAKKTVQHSLLWKLPNGRYAVFCGTGSKDLKSWKIRMAGIMDEKEIRSVTVKLLRNADRFLVPENPSSGKAEDNEKTAAGGK